MDMPDLDELDMNCQNGYNSFITHDVPASEYASENVVNVPSTAANNGTDNGLAVNDEQYTLTLLQNSSIKSPDQSLTFDVNDNQLSFGTAKSTQNNSNTSNSAEESLFDLLRDCPEIFENSLEIPAQTSTGYNSGNQPSTSTAHLGYSNNSSLVSMQLAPTTSSPNWIFTADVPNILIEPQNYAQYNLSNGTEMPIPTSSSNSSNQYSISTSEMALSSNITHIRPPISENVSISTASEEKVLNYVATSTTTRKRNLEIDIAQDSHLQLKKKRKTEGLNFEAGFSLSNNYSKACFSDKLNKLFVMPFVEIPVKFNWDTNAAKGLDLHVSFVVRYIDPGHWNTPVRRCNKHENIGMASLGVVYLGHEVRDVCERDGELAVRMREPTTVLVRFTCFNSCPTINKRRTALVCTLKDQNCVYGTKFLDYHAVAKPPGSMKSHEELEEENQKKKRMKKNKAEETSASCRCPSRTCIPDVLPTPPFTDNETQEDPAKPVELSILLPDRGTALQVVEFIRDKLQQPNSGQQSTIQLQQCLQHLQSQEQRLRDMQQ